MMLLLQLLLSHLVGDFVLQTTAMIKDKQEKKLRSAWLYLHCLVHGILVLLFTGNPDFWPWAIVVAVSHLFIDALKILFTTPDNERTFFFVDQILHLLVLLAVFFTVERQLPEILLQWMYHKDAWLFITCIVFLTTPVSHFTRMVISRWTPSVIGFERNNISENDSLMNAGKYIGILERLFVFGFIISGHFEAVGFLLGAKSIFRFGDLRDSGDRKLTEYVLIGTLVSFGIAMLTGWIYLELANGAG